MAVIAEYEQIRVGLTVDQLVAATPNYGPEPPDLVLWRIIRDEIAHGRVVELAVGS